MFYGFAHVPSTHIKTVTENVSFLRARCIAIKAPNPYGEISLSSFLPSSRLFQCDFVGNKFRKLQFGAICRKLKDLDKYELRGGKSEHSTAIISLDNSKDHTCTISGL